jgi:hypothetical protein
LAALLSARWSDASFQQADPQCPYGLLAATPWCRQVRRLIGKGGDKLMWELIGVQKSSEEGERLSEKRFQMFKSQYLPGIKPFPKVRVH